MYLTFFLLVLFYSFRLNLLKLFQNKFWKLSNFFIDSIQSSSVLTKLIKTSEKKLAITLSTLQGSNLIQNVMPSRSANKYRHFKNTCTTWFTCKCDGCVYQVSVVRSVRFAFVPTHLPLLLLPLHLFAAVPSFVYGCCHCYDDGYEIIKFIQQNILNCFHRYVTTTTTTTRQYCHF